MRSWFVFVNGRRLDTSHRVAGPLALLAAVLAAGALAVPLLVLFAEPAYLEAVRAGATKDNRFFEIVTYVGKSDWILYSTAALMLFLSFASADRFKGRRHAAWHRVFLFAWFLFSAVALSGLITNLFKFLVGRARPYAVSGSSPWEMHPLVSGYDFASFPSGHSTTAGAMVVGLALLFPRWRWPVLAGGLTVAASRAFIGVHFPSDILAGFLLGAVFTLVWARSFARKRLLFAFTQKGGIELRRVGGDTGRVGPSAALLAGRGGKSGRPRRQAGGSGRG